MVSVVRIKAVDFQTLYMSSVKKQVRFSEQDGRNTSLSQTLTLRRIETPNSDTSSRNIRKKKKQRKTKLQLLKAEKKKLQRDLKNTKEGILEDSERKASPIYTPYESRQRLARTASATLTKLQQIQGKIVTKEKTNKLKVQRKLSSKLQKRSIKADKQHNRIIKMTSRMERMKLGEEELRSEIDRELKEGEVYRPTELTDTESSRFCLPRIRSADSADWIKLSSLPEHGLDREEQHSRPASVLSEYAIQLSPSEKRIVADKLAHKYDMTRELRNTIHEHMISRCYSFSYFNIIPPYKRKKPKPQKTRQVFNRLVYEDKIGVMDFRKLKPKKVVLSS